MFVHNAFVRRLVSVAVVVVLAASTTRAKIDRNAPHPHRGLLSPYEPGPFRNLKLTSKDEQHLLQGKPVMKQTLPPADKQEEGGTAICIQDVEAPKPAVWNQILGLTAYHGKVPKVKESKNYVVKKNRDGSSTIKTVMKLGVMPGYTYTNYYDHTFYSNDDSMVWTLDYDKSSDFDDVVGHWHLEDHPSKPGWTRVFYACDVKTKTSVPGPVLNFISKSALKQATHWVKKESESNPHKEVPREYASRSTPSAKQVVKEKASGAVGASTSRPSPVTRFGGVFGKRFSRAQ